MREVGILFVLVIDQTLRYIETVVKEFSQGGWAMGVYPKVGERIRERLTALGYIKPAGGELDVERPRGKLKSLWLVLPLAAAAVLSPSGARAGQPLSVGLRLDVVPLIGSRRWATA
jgi:hypothetical protein